MNKKISIIGIFILTVTAFTTVVSINACKKNKDCPTGYEGDNCDVKTITKFLGDWKAFETCSIPNGTGEFQIEISPNPSSATEIKIDGFAQAIPVIAEVNGNSFTVDGTFEGYYFKGTGSITSDGKTISVSYIEDDQFFNYSCSGTWTKQ